MTSAWNLSSSPMRTHLSKWRDKYWACRVQLIRTVYHIHNGTEIKLLQRVSQEKVEFPIDYDIPFPRRFILDNAVNLNALIHEITRAGAAILTMLSHFFLMARLHRFYLLHHGFILQQYIEPLI